MSRWYAIRTHPGAQRPNKYNQAITAVERALTDNGFTHYMPTEKRLIRDRLRPHVWKTRRVALMVGYVFIHEPHDWLLLSETEGVAGVVGVRGTPMPVSIADILIVREAEAEAEVEFDRKLRNANSSIRKRARHDPRFRVKVRKLAEHLTDVGTISIPSEELAA